MSKRASELITSIVYLYRLTLHTNRLRLGPPSRLLASDYEVNKAMAIWRLW
jgi:hypothetical protein